VNWTCVKEIYRYAGEVKSAVYNCLVPYDDTSIETSLSLDMLQLLLLDYIAVLLHRLMPPIVNDRVAWSVDLSVGLSPIVSLAKTSEAIEITFALMTRVGPG